MYLKHGVDLLQTSCVATILCSFEKSWTDFLTSKSWTLNAKTETIIMAWLMLGKRILGRLYFLELNPRHVPRAAVTKPNSIFYKKPSKGRYCQKRGHETRANHFSLRRSQRSQSENARRHKTVTTCSILSKINRNIIDNTQKPASRLVKKVICRKATTLLIKCDTTRPNRCTNL